MMLSQKLSIKERELWILAIVILLISGFIVISCYSESIQSLKENAAKLEENSMMRSREYAELRREADSLKSQLSELKEYKERLPYSDEMLIQKLGFTGFNGEIEDIENDLRMHPELIPYPGVLGGTMGYAGIRVLSDKWVLAYYEDGHIDGYMMVSYKWNGSGFQWKLVDSYLVGQ